MRRLLLVLTVAALMAAMMVSAGPAKADGFSNERNIDNGLSVVQSGGDYFVSWGDDDYDIYGFDNDVVFFQSDSTLDTFAPEGITFG